MSKSFSVGGVYFRVKYPDPSRKYPLIDTFVFVGENLSEEDEEDTWYFQFADSFAQFGSILESTGGDRRVSCLLESELEEMLDLQQLLSELVDSKQRREVADQL